MTDFERELSALLNKHCRDNDSNTPDFILAKYINDCLNAFVLAMDKRDSWTNPSNNDLERTQ